jgi:hypothetical protein
MRQRNYFTGLFLAVCAMLLATCEKKDGEEVDPLVGTYTFTSATLNDTVKMKVPVYGDIILLPGTDASLFVSEGLLGAAPCDDSTNAAVELKNDGKTYYACLNEDNEEQMGTWLINTERTELILNISNPQPFSLNLSNLNITPSKFSGTVENFPLPVDASLELGASLPGGGVNYQTSSVDLVFTKIP